MTIDTETRHDADGRAVDAAAYLVAPVDERSRARLAENGLDYRVVPVAGDDYPQWLQVVARGFQDGERTDEQVASSRERSAYRRVTGVYDPAVPIAGAPVGTIASWIGQLTVPGAPRCRRARSRPSPSHPRTAAAASPARCSRANWAPPSPQVLRSRCSP
nr:hypothetical protein GCM10025699_33990 [Microbacterium flavescens]